MSTMIVTPMSTSYVRVAGVFHSDEVTQYDEGMYYTNFEGNNSSIPMEGFILNLTVYGQHQIKQIFNNINTINNIPCIKYKIPL